jgi:hypothetical protein
LYNPQLHLLVEIDRNLVINLVNLVDELIVDKTKILIFKFRKKQRNLMKLTNDKSGIEDKSSRGPA